MINNRPQTAGSWLVDQLRSLIIGGELVPGSAIRQEELAERFAVSRMPVRQALDVLAAEGWVEQRPHRGAVVSALDADDALELFGIRAALECLAIERSFPNLTEAQLAKIDQVWTALKASDGNQPILHQSFHLALYAAAGPRLLRLVMQHLDATQRYLCFENYALTVADSDIEEHGALVAAAKAGDVKRGIAIIHAHVGDGGRGIAASLRARQTRSSANDRDDVVKGTFENRSNQTP